MRNYIIITKAQADAIRGRYGIYSAIEPLEIPDGNFIVPERCIDDPDLKDVKSKLKEFVKADKENVQDIEDLPKEGKEVVKNKLYLYDGGADNPASGIVKCLKTKILKAGKPEDDKEGFLVKELKLI